MPAAAAGGDTLKCTLHRCAAALGETQQRIQQLERELEGIKTDMAQLKTASVGGGGTPGPCDSRRGCRLDTRGGQQATGRQAGLGHKGRDARV
jgi:hypothetical protein